MITYQLLKDCPQHIPSLAQIWYDVLGKIWAPDVLISTVEERFHAHCNDDTLPLTIVALQGDTPVGMASLRINDGIRDDLTPWLGSLCIAANSQGYGIGTQLMHLIQDKAKAMGYEHLYLFTFDPTLPTWYTHHHWHIIGEDTFRGHAITVMAWETLSI